MEREKQWKTAKDAFIALVLKEAPPKLGRERIVAPVIDKHDGPIVTAFKQLDEIDGKFQKILFKAEIEELNGMLSEASSITSTLNTHVKSMLASLQQGIDRFKQDEAPGKPKMKENLVRGLKVLKTSLDAITKLNDSWIVQSRVSIEGRTKDLNAFEVMAKQFTTALRSTVAAGLAAAQRVKAKPTRETYNNEFPGAARDITQQIGNVKKLAGKGFEVPGPKDTAPLLAALVPFANGDLMNADPGTPKEDILKWITQYNKAVKAVADAYGLR